MRLMTTLLLITATAAMSIDTQQWREAKRAVEQEALAKQNAYEKYNAANAQISENQSLYDAVYYRLDLFPDVESQILYGDVSMTARSLSDGLDRAELDFLDNLVVDSVYVNGQPVNFLHNNDLLVLPFNGAVADDSLFTTRVVYHGQPQQSGFGAFAFDSHAGKPMVWTLSEPFGARNWWPCKDAPADKADSMDIIVTVRSDLIVASNGSLKSVTEKEGKKTYWWHEQYPMATYLASLAIYPYYTYSDWYIHSGGDSMEVQFYVFPGSLDQARPQNAKTVAMISAFSELFGQYPFIKEKYGHAQFLWGGGMEHQTITSLGGYSEGIIAHELSHQWWGDMVTCHDFHHIWLNEGFATYSEALWWEYNYGTEALHEDMSYNVYLGPETVYVEDPLRDDVFYYRTTYQKASWVLHMLRHVVGDQNFFEILRTYYDEFKYKTATTESFRDLCERVSGVELDQFFDQWIYKSGAPHYQWMWQKQQTEDGWRVSGRIAQVQPGPTVFHMPIDIRVTTASGEKTFVIENATREQEFDVLVDGEPLSVQFDPDNWILKQAEEIKLPEFHVLQATFTDVDGHERNSFMPGEMGYFVFKAENKGVSSQSVDVLLTSDDSSVLIENGIRTYSDIPAGATTGNADEPFIFTIQPGAASHLARINLTFSPKEGGSQKQSFILPIGEPALLIVDDDDGADYEQYYQAMADYNNIFAEIWNVAEQGAVSSEKLDDYPAVLWFTGDTADSTLTPEDQAVLRSFLSGGGKLLLTGQNIAADLAGGSEADRDFLENVLHVGFIDDVSPDESVVGVIGDPVGDGLALRFNDVYFGAHNQNSPDEIEALEPALTSLFYLPSRKTAGIRWHDSTIGSGFVFFAFGLEGVAGPKAESAAQVLDRVMAWFNNTTAIEKDANVRVPSDFVLQQNFPNPFNPRTAITYYAPEPGIIEAAIYDLRGRSVKVYAPRYIQAGWHITRWDGKGDDGVAASGLYFFSIKYKSENNSSSNTVKMIKLE